MIFSLIEYPRRRILLVALNDKNFVDVSIFDIAVNLKGHKRGPVKF